MQHFILEMKPIKLTSEIRLTAIFPLPSLLLCKLFADVTSCSLTSDFNRRIDDMYMSSSMSLHPSIVLTRLILRDRVTGVSWSPSQRSSGEGRVYINVSFAVNVIFWLIPMERCLVYLSYLSFKKRQLLFEDEPQPRQFGANMSENTQGKNGSSFIRPKNWLYLKCHFDREAYLFRFLPKVNIL